MKDFILVQARTGSKRFKNKILRKIHNKTILEILVNRLKNSILKDKIIILTTKKREDLKIVNICKKINILYFRGSENDLVKRYYDCVKKFNISLLLSPANCIIFKLLFVLLFFIVPFVE